MKAVGITVLLAGILFTVFAYFMTPDAPTYTSAWAPFIGLLVIATGAVTIFMTRKTSHTR